ncbi:fused MFS/spermidine synthase [Brachybacterium sp. J144]|uniref:spermidine synthase n=1 Tax=Brachybacterium sp. J144 TaxID=3116487 RepID=UPI002E76785A|nr:fused MFS/spermidine synthase [Brachybacterium sp. J144]MEE1649344.1 fused MFS/spermidine synthase [Brachybacterium sp. J144]
MSSSSAPSFPGSPRQAQLSFSDQPAWIVADEVVGGWALLIGGVEQSHVDLEDPTRLVHEYLRRMGNVLDAVRPAGEPLRIAHLGGGALTLVRYVQATRPGSEQLVVEIERELPGLVTAALPLPEGTDLVVVIGDAREELATRTDRRFDAIVLDVFSGEESPAHLATAAFYAEALAHLDADGLLLVNVGDDAGQRFLAAQVRELEEAAAGAGLPGVWALTDAQLLSRPADGNVVLLAGGALASPEVEEWRAAWLAAGPHPAAVLDPVETERAFGAGRPRT